MPKIGDLAPDFTLPDGQGVPVTLSALRPRKVVLYFYPKDDTPGCTLEAQDFTALLPQFEAAGATVLGLSKDSVKDHAKFCRKYGLGVPLLSDAEGQVCEEYGVWGEKVMFGRNFMGIERATFLVGPEGRIAALWQPVTVEGHAEAVLAAVKALA